MSRPLQQVQRFFRELKRRNVYKVAVAYLAVAFVGIQAARLLVPPTTLPGWADDLLIYLAVFGFPVALVIAWAFEMTPEGVRRTAEAETPAGEDGGAGTGTRTSAVLLVAMGLAATAAAGWYLGGLGESDITDRSLAVLPFQSIGGQESEQIARGVHDDLLTRLSRVSDLRVISRTSVERYRETEKSLPEIARELEVKWILEGGVQQANDRIRVNAQLIDAPADDHRWAENYERSLTAKGLFGIQEDLTKQIAESLQVELTARERERIERSPTGDLVAYRLYVSGRTHLEERTEEALRRGLRLFHRAIEEDSSYALAWSGIADAKMLMRERGYGSPDTLPPQAFEAARRALSLDPDLAEPHASLGLLYQHELAGPRAIAELRRAIELRPSYARAHHWLGWALAAVGRLDTAVSHLERAAELDPLSPSILVSLSAGYSYLGDLEDALRWARRSAELGYTGGTEYEGRILSKLGRQEEAIATLQRVLAEMDPSPYLTAWTRAWLAVAHRRAGETRRAGEILARIEERGGYPFAEAVVMAALGDRDGAFARFRAARPDFAESAALRYSPVFDPLRGDPEFSRLMRELNEMWGLNPDGSFPDRVQVSFAPEAPG